MTVASLTSLRIINNASAHYHCMYRSYIALHVSYQIQQKIQQSHIEIKHYLLSNREIKSLENIQQFGGYLEDI